MAEWCALASVLGTQWALTRVLARLDRQEARRIQASWLRRLAAAIRLSGLRRAVAESSRREVACRSRGVDPVAVPLEHLISGDSSSEELVHMVGSSLGESPF